MSQLRDDLIAAKALIDAGSSMLAAIEAVCGEHTHRAHNCYNALNQCRAKPRSGRRPTLREIEDRRLPGEAASLFDRAIEAAS